jgi:hypothetical protein
MLIDKTKAPKWKPATLKEVSPQAVAAEYFAPLAPEQELMLTPPGQQQRREGGGGGAAGQQGGGGGGARSRM